MPEIEEGQKTRIYLKSKRAPIVVAGGVDAIAEEISNAHGVRPLVGFENAGHTFEGRVYVDPTDVVGLRSAERREVESPEPSDYFAPGGGDYTVTEFDGGDGRVLRHVWDARTGAHLRGNGVWEGTLEEYLDYNAGSVSQYRTDDASDVETHGG